MRPLGCGTIYTVLATYAVWEYKHPGEGAFAYSKKLELDPDSALPTHAVKPRGS